MKRIYSLPALMLLAIAAPAQTTSKLTATVANEYGIVYSLPKTVLDIVIETEKTVKEPGIYYRYAKTYLDIDDPIDEPSVNTVVKSVTLIPRGISDPDRRYVVKFKPGVSPYVVINEENLPLAINTENVLQTEGVELPQPVAAEPTPLDTEAARHVVSEEMLQSQSTAKRAELAAAQIYALRQSRTELITGQADAMPPDGKAMQLVLDNIEAQEAALMAMFVGTTSVSTDVATVQYQPDRDVTDQVIARVSATDGVVPADDLSGAPLLLSLKITERGKMPVNEKGVTLPFPKNGFAYCIPGKAQVSIEYEGMVMADERIDVAQFGIDYGLAPNSFTDKKAPIYLIFNPVTGAAAEIGAAKQ